MKVKDLIEVLKQRNGEDEIEIHLHQNHKLMQGPDAVIALPASEYVLASFKPVQHEGWEGLVTLEVDEFMGG
jgi:hypothetical protein